MQIKVSVETETLFFPRDHLHNGTILDLEKPAPSSIIWDMKIIKEKSSIADTDDDDDTDTIVWEVGLGVNNKSKKIVFNNISGAKNLDSSMTCEKDTEKDFDINLSKHEVHKTFSNPTTLKMKDFEENNPDIKRSHNNKDNINSVGQTSEKLDNCNKLDNSVANVKEIYSEPESSEQKIYKKSDEVPEFIKAQTGSTDLHNKLSTGKQFCEYEEDKNILNNNKNIAKDNNSQSPHSNNIPQNQGRKCEPEQRQIGATRKISREGSYIVIEQEGEDIIGFEQKFRLTDTDLMKLMELGY